MQYLMDYHTHSTNSIDGKNSVLELCQSAVDKGCTTVHNFPFDEVHGLHKTKEELEQSGILVDVLPHPDATLTHTKNYELHANPATKEIWYVYTDRPPTPDERIAQLEA